MARRWDTTRGRWSWSVSPSDLNLPHVIVYGEGTDFAYASVEYGTNGSDPVLRLSVDLEGTRLGRLIAEVAWRWRVHRRPVENEPAPGVIHTASPCQNEQVQP